DTRVDASGGGDAESRRDDRGADNDGHADRGNGVAERVEYHGSAAECGSPERARRERGRSRRGAAAHRWRRRGHRGSRRRRARAVAPVVANIVIWVIGPRALRLALGAGFLFALGTSMSAHAAPPATTVEVTIQNFAFSPLTISIDKGDTIRWTNLDSAPHGAVTVQPGFVTQILGQGQSTTTTFDRPGTFDYICNVHGATMRGTVVVRGAPVAETAAPAV